MIVVAHLTQAQAATIISAVFTIVQYTFGLILVIILVYFMYNTNSAIAWSGVTRTLHSSLWPILLRTDSASTGARWSRIALLSNLSLLGAILIAVAGVVTPLGLSDGPLVQTDYVSMGATYIPDSSSIGRATSPRDKFAYSRICGGIEPVPCPGNGINGNTSRIDPPIVERFSSTPYGPFNMQFRRYYQGVGGYNYSMATAKVGTVESLILRDDIFAIEGLIVDLTKTPGIGLRNHTLPTLQRGGVWSEEVLWLEPFSACVNTNLTIDYQQQDNSGTEDVKKYNLTDRGGFVNLTRDYPALSLDGYNFDIREHAYKAAVVSNACRLRSFNNMTRDESYIGKTFPSNSSKHSWPAVGKMQSLSLGEFLNQNLTEGIDPELDSVTRALRTLCRGYGGADIANITNISVYCSLLLGPPFRIDGGDPRLPGDNTTWRQTLHACVGTPRARMQQVELSFNGTSTLDNLRISRQNTNTSVLWAIEKTNLMIADVQVFWGRVADSYENDTSLSTIRSEVFYLPGTIWDSPSAGNPSSVPASLFGTALENLAFTNGPDYTASSNYAMLTKWQSLIEEDPEKNPTQIINMIWTDMAANNLVGTNIATTLKVAPYVASVDYDGRYGIPALLFICLWLPVFFMASFILLRGGLRISYLRHLLNQTSIGRVLIGDSTIRASSFDPKEDRLESRQSQPVQQPEIGYSATSHLDTKDWKKTIGETPVVFGPTHSVLESPAKESPAYETPTKEPLNQETPIKESPALGAEAAGEILIASHLAGNSGAAQNRTALRISLKEYVLSDLSHPGTHPDLPRTEPIV